MKKTRCENCDCEINYLLKAPRFCKSRECQAVYKEIKRRRTLKRLGKEIKPYVVVKPKINKKGYYAKILRKDEAKDWSKWKPSML